MRLHPDARNLLATALAAFRDEVLPALPHEKRYAALMVANALAMAEREFSTPEPSLLATAELYRDVALTPEQFEERFAADIEAGAFDEAGPERNAAFEAIKTINAARLAVTNPKRLRD